MDPVWIDALAGVKRPKQAQKALLDYPFPPADAVAAQSNRVQRGVRIANWLWLRPALSHAMPTPRRPAFSFERWKDILRRTIDMRAPQSEFPDHPLDQQRAPGEPSRKKRKANFTGPISTVVSRRNETIAEIEQRYNIEFKSDSCPDVVDFYDVDYNVDALWNLPVDVERGIYFDLIFLNFHYELESLDRALVTDLDAEAMTFRYSTMELFFGVSSPVPWFGSYPMQVRRSLYALIKH